MRLSLPLKRRAVGHSRSTLYLWLATLMPPAVAAFWRPLWAKQMAGSQQFLSAVVARHSVCGCRAFTAVPWTC